MQGWIGKVRRAVGKGGLIKTLQKRRTVVARRIFNVFLNNGRTSFNAMSQVQTNYFH